MQENTAKTAAEWVLVARSVAQMPGGEGQALSCIAQSRPLTYSVEDWLKAAIHKPENSIIDSLKEADKFTTKYNLTKAPAWITPSESIAYKYLASTLIAVNSGWTAHYPKKPAIT